MSRPGKRRKQKNGLCGGSRYSLGLMRVKKSPVFGISTPSMVVWERVYLCPCISITCCQSSNGGVFSIAVVIYMLKLPMGLSDSLNERYREHELDEFSHAQHDSSHLGLECPKTILSYHDDMTKVRIWVWNASVGDGPVGGNAGDATAVEHPSFVDRKRGARSAYMHVPVCIHAEGSVANPFWR